MFEFVNLNQNNSKNRMVRYEHYPTDIEPVDLVAEYKYDTIYVKCEMSDVKCKML